MSVAIITGITGQDGSYLAELLLQRGYRVVGLLRPDSDTPHDRIRNLDGRVELITADLRDFDQVLRLVNDFEPREIYNLAADSSGRVSWRESVASGEARALRVRCLLEAIRQTGGKTRFFQAGSSEMYGNAVESPQRETTPFRPHTPYAVAKVRAFRLVTEYRNRFGIHAVNGVLFNHESPRRNPRFVTRKVTDAVARISFGLASQVQLGNLDSRRDWGFAGDSVDAMWRMLQSATADDYVIGTGTTHSVRELCETAFACVGLDYRDFVTVDAALKRDTDGPVLVADASRLRTELRWQPTVSFSELVEMMVHSDLQRYEERRSAETVQGRR